MCCAAQQPDICVPEITWRSVPGWGLCLSSLVSGRSRCLVLKHQDLSIHLNSALAVTTRARGKEASTAVKVVVLDMRNQVVSLSGNGTAWAMLG